jgi:hypothetical protein
MPLSQKKVTPMFDSLAPKNLQIATELFGPRCSPDDNLFCNGSVRLYPETKTGEVSAILEVDGERSGFFGPLEWFEKLIKKNGGGDVLTALEKSIRQDTAEMKVEEAAEQFVQDCHARRLSYEEARAAILADKTKIGEWANRAGEQQFKYAWQQAALDEEECSESELAPVSIPADDLEPPPAPSDGNAEPTDQSLEPDRDEAGTSGPTFPEPDRDQFEIFVDASFRHCSKEGIVNLRSFHQNDANKAFRYKTCISLKDGLKPLIEATVKEARRAAKNPEPINFCPPVATFKAEAGWHAREEDLLEGPVLSVELDANPRIALAKLESLLGPATLVVRSGGVWINSETGETEDKLHAYWRLKEPACGEDLIKLKRVRQLAANLVGADPSNVPINHPIRWPGSWHCKSTPRLCEIISSTEHIDNEIDLDVALATLEAAAPQSREEFGFTQKSSSKAAPEFEVPPGLEDIPFEHLGGDSYPKTANPGRIAAALAVIPNSKRLYVLRGVKIEGSEDDDLDWHGWATIGMATWNATGGSKEGFFAFLPWSRKWSKYIAATAEEKKRFDRNTMAKWNAFSTSPPKDIGAGTIFYLADKASPGWRDEYEGGGGGEGEGEGGSYGSDGLAPRPGALPPPQPTSLPFLIVNSSDPTATAKDLATLIAKRDDFLFNGNAAVHIAIEAGYPPRALEVVTDTVRVLAHKICIPTKRQGDKRIKVPLSKDIAQLYLYGLEGSWGLKPFNGITTAPILGDDGSIRTASGYDARSKLWCYNIPDITVPAKPTKNDAEQALIELRTFFRTFPFADAERLRDRDLAVEVVNLSEPVGLDESSFLATLLTAVCRQSLELAPGFLCDAPNFSGSGTGKGLLVKATCTVAAGFTPAAFTAGHDAEELDKRLTSALIEGRPATFLDNFNSKSLTSDTLSSALTESPAMVRVFGLTKMIPLYTRTYIGITGNAVQIAEDMARRLLNTHLNAKMENPEQRKFAPGFLDHVLAARPKLLTAALIIWRWGRQNKLDNGKPLGSYELWAQWCRDPLIALGMRDPVDRIDEIKAADPKRKSLITIFDQWWTSDADAELKANELADEVIKLIDDKAFVKTDGPLQYSRQRVASFLTKNIDTRVGGYVLTKITKGLTSKDTAKYKLIRTQPPRD